MTKKTWKNTTCPNGQLNGHGGHHHGVLQAGMVSTPPKCRARHAAASCGRRVPPDVAPSLATAVESKPPQLFTCH